MTDLILRADAIEAIRKKLQDWGSYAFEDYRRGLYEAQDIIDALSSADAVEVVRCKNCKASRVYGKTTQWLACESVMEGQATDPDGYCYLGERRE